MFEWITTELVKDLNPWPRKHSVLVLDGASAHKWGPVRAFLDRLDIVVVFTPAYSPQYNPIEVTFNTFKRDVRTLGYGLGSDALLDVVFRSVWKHWRHSLEGPMRDAGYLDACRPWRGPQ